MTVLRQLVFLVSLACPALAQEPLMFGAPVTGGISGGQSLDFRFTASAGDEVSGHAELLGVEGNLRFLDAAGNSVPGLKVRNWYLGGTAGRRVGFVAPASGTYQLRVTASSPTGGTYTLRLERLSVASRMRGVSVTPKEVSTSERIRQLSRDVQQGRRDVVDQFWREVAGKGPLVESIEGNDRDLLVTFLWRETYQTHNVLVGWPMAAWRADDYYMSRLSNTDVWYKTIQLRRGSRFSYWLAPNLGEGAGDRVFKDQLDPLNPRVFPEDPNSTTDVSSVLDTPGAPDETWVRRTPARRGVVEQKKFRFTLSGAESDIWVYTPPDYAAAAGPYPLLVLFDGDTYVRADFNDAIRTLDNLISDRRMRPVVVCFVDSLFRRLSPRNPVGDVMAAYGDAIVGELLPQLRSTYAISASARDAVVGGFSAGGLMASLTARRHSDVFGNVLAQSGAFRLRMQLPLIDAMVPSLTTLTKGGEEPTSIAQMYLDAPRLPIRFYLETGLYENTPSATLPMHEMALDEGITASNRHFRDVLIAKGYEVIYRETPGAHESVHWRATLAEALVTLFTRAE